MGDDAIATMILCAGLGTRLRPLSDWRAKALVPVGDQPAIAHVVARVRALNGPIVANAFHRAEDVVGYGRANGITVVVERELLGTGGGIANAREPLGEGDVLVWNGDILAELDAVAIAEAHRASGALATLVIRRRAAGEGNVGLDASGRVVRLRRETTAPGEVSGGEFLGVHVIGAELRKALPHAGCVVGDAYLPSLRAGGRLGVVEVTTPFIDVGSPEGYLQANRAWLARRGVASWIAETAKVDPRASVEGSVIGAGASVEGSTKVEGCVVWPGAVVRESLRSAIVAPEGVLRATSGDD